MPDSPLSKSLAGVALLHLACKIPTEIFPVPTEIFWDIAFGQTFLSAFLLNIWFSGLEGELIFHRNHNFILPTEIKLLQPKFNFPTEIK